MSNKKLHPTVQQFKEFVKKHPKMVSEVRGGNSTWQDLYEEWYLLGEEDSRWDEYKEMSVTESSSTNGVEKKEWIPQIMGAIKNMDAEQLQGYIYSLSQAIGTIQGLISQFPTGNQAKSTSNEKVSHPQHPFQFRKD